MPSLRNQTDCLILQDKVVFPEKNPKNIRGLIIDNSRTACCIGYADTNWMGPELAGWPGYRPAFKIATYRDQHKTCQAFPV